MEETQRKELKELIDRKRKSAFTSEYQSKATDAEVLGIIVSQYLEWNGDAILQVAVEALEDANFHRESAQVNTMRTTL